MEVLDAVNLASGIYCERDAVKATVAYYTSEAARVVGFPHSPQDPVQDGLRACGTLLQSGLLGERTGKSGAGEVHGSPTGILPPYLTISLSAYDLVKGAVEQLLV